MKVSGCGGTTKAVVVRFVTKPLLLTVITGINEPAPYVPGAELTVANVKATAPGPVAVPSPDSDVM